MNSSDGGSDVVGDRPRSGPRATYPTARPADSRRRWFVGLSVLVVVAGVAIAWLGYTKFAGSDVTGEVTGYEILNPSTVAVQFTLTRKDPAQQVACVVRGRSKDGDETGRREILIPSGTQTQTGVRTEVATSRPPVIGEVFGCTANVPAYLTSSTT
ncbi:DUF4307 domain-containing protein [Gordonia rhizosphera]|uniref:DUF4307 domain-containing protein n=1 Tax=Gordonia rhizosphera TaxID=83341 RepID=UPI0002E2C028|nr:DUF4307 domain-containing protein [Gordonia rhizosphera]